MSSPAFRHPPAPDGYWSGGWRGDLVAGLTLAVVLIPQAMAYGLLAGIDPVYGLYAALFPLLVYTLLASTPHVSVGPTALASLLCLNGLSGIAEPGTPEYLSAAILLAGLTGCLQLIFGILRAGGLVSLLSRPVLSGFVSAAALLIIASQLRSLFGLDMGRTNFFHETLLELWRTMGTLHGPSTFLGLGTIGLLLVGNHFAPKRPFLIVLVILATVLVWGFRLDESGVAVVGSIPEGLPGLYFPSLDWATLRELLPVAAVLALISFIETLSIGKAFSPNYDYYRVQPDRELVALGLSKLVGAIFFAIPTSASFSRSAVVEQGGGRGPVSGLVAVLLVAATLLFLTPVFYYLPIPVLAGVIIYSVRNLFDWAEMRRLWRLRPKELATLLVTFLFTLFAGLQYGIAGGVILSLAFVFLRAARPHLAELGRIPGTNAFRNLSRFSSAEVDPKLLIVRFDAELYFGNAEYFRDRIEELARARGPELRVVILDTHTMNDLDSSGLFALTQLRDALAARKVELFLCGMIGPVRDMLYRSGMMEQLGADHQFLSIQDAIHCFHHQADARDWDRPALQHG